MLRRSIRVLTCSVACLVLLGTTAVTSAATSSTGAPAKRQPPFRVLVTNDDGVGAPGIDALVEALRDLPGVKVTVIAPNENKSGTGSDTTPGELVTADATTTSGHAATAVTGFPADTVVFALDQGGMKKRPNLVISGINAGQNVGLAVDLSGTIGAAKAAAARGVPALAVSQGLAEGAEPDYESGVDEAIAWVKEHRKALTPKKGETVDVILENLNIPTCTAGELRGHVEVPVASPDVPGIVDPQNCASTLEDPANDVEGLLNGYVTLTELPIPTT
jgi:5'-nucleotidase